MDTCFKFFFLVLFDVQFRVCNSLEMQLIDNKKASSISVSSKLVVYINFEEKWTERILASNFKHTYTGSYRHLHTYRYGRK